LKEGLAGGCAMKYLLVLGVVIVVYVIVRVSFKKHF